MYIDIRMSENRGKKDKYTYSYMINMKIKIHSSCEIEDLSKPIFASCA